MKVTYTEEAVADIVEAITYLNERNPAAAVNLAAEIVRCIERLADREFEGPVSRLRSGAISSSLTYHSPITIAPGAKSRTYTLRVPVSSELYAIHFSSDDHGRERPVAP